MEFVKGEKEISIKEWMLGLLKYLFHELVANGKLLGTLIMLTILVHCCNRCNLHFQRVA